MLLVGFICIVNLAILNGKIARLEANPRIINGIPTTTDDYPFMVSLQYYLPQYNYSSHFCGATILESDPLVVLTAAHCTDGISSYFDSIGLEWEIHAQIGRTDVTLNGNDSDTTDTTSNYQSYTIFCY